MSDSDFILVDYPSNHITQTTNNYPSDDITPTNNNYPSNDITLTNNNYPSNDITPINNNYPSNDITPTNNNYPSNDITPTNNNYPSNDITQTTPSLDVHTEKFVPQEHIIDIISESESGSDSDSAPDSNSESESDPESIKSNSIQYDIENPPTPDETEELINLYYDQQRDRNILDARIRNWKNYFCNNYDQESEPFFEPLFEQSEQESEPTLIDCAHHIKKWFEILFNDIVVFLFMD